MAGTGYVGSAVLSRFLALETKHQYTVMTRSEEKAKLIDQLRPGQVKSVQGSHQDLDLIEKLASENDITFNCADSDDVGQVFALFARYMGSFQPYRHRPCVLPARSYQSHS
jgi:nucleoside-diphosphate-sugar epimerase